MSATIGVLEKKLKACEVELAAAAEELRAGSAVILALRRELREAREHFAQLHGAHRITELEELCSELCRDNLEEEVGADGVNHEWGRWVIVGEDGEPIVNADTPAAVLRQMHEQWCGVN